MKALLASPVVKKIASVVAGIFVVAPAVPPLAPYAALLVPVGTFLLGAFHVDTKPGAP